MLYEVITIAIENVGAGHRVPAGFSQEREFWVHLRVTDADGRLPGGAREHHHRGRNNFV